MLQKADTAANLPTVKTRLHRIRHSKKRFYFYLLVPELRLSDSDFRRVRAACILRGGWYSRRWAGQPGGFAFRDRDQAEALQNEIAPDGQLAIDAESFPSEQREPLTMAAPRGWDKIDGGGETEPITFDVMAKPVRAVQDTFVELPEDFNF